MIKWLKYPPIWNFEELSTFTKQARKQKRVSYDHKYEHVTSSKLHLSYYNVRRTQEYEIWTKKRMLHVTWPNESKN